MKKPKLEQVNAYFMLMLAAGVLIALWGVSRDADWLALCGLLVMLAAIPFRLVFYRCPHCGGYLDRNSGTHCQHCGKAFREKE